MERFLAQNKSNVVVKSYFAPFCPFYLLTQTDHFAKVFAWWVIFAHNKSVSVRSCFLPSWHFKFLTQTHNFSRAIAYALWSILTIFKNLMVSLDQKLEMLRTCQKPFLITLELFCVKDRSKKQ